MKTLNGKTLGSKIPQELREKIKNHIVFKPLGAHGYEATVLILSHFGKPVHYRMTHAGREATSRQ